MDGQSEMFEVFGRREDDDTVLRVVQTAAISANSTPRNGVEFANEGWLFLFWQCLRHRYHPLLQLQSPYQPRFHLRRFQRHPA